MAAEEEYQRTGFEGKDLKVIDTLLRTYFDASGWEFSELIQANRNYYIKQGASPHPDQYEFFKDKDIIIDYPIDLYTKLEDFTRNDEYLIPMTDRIPLSGYYLISTATILPAVSYRGNQ